MATIALASASGFAAGSQGYAMMVALGAIIDTQIILPSLFPADPIESSRIGEIQVMSADEGGAVPQCYGLSPKTTGQLIWCGDLEEVVSSTRTGKNTRHITYTYFADMAVAICAVATGKPIVRVDEIKADGNTVFRHPDGLAFLSKDQVGVLFAGSRILFNTEAGAYTDFAVGDRILTKDHGGTGSGSGDRLLPCDTGNRYGLGLDNSINVIGSKGTYDWTWSPQSGGTATTTFYAWNMGGGYDTEYYRDGGAHPGGPFNFCPPNGHTRYAPVAHTNAIRLRQDVGQGWRDGIQRSNVPTVYNGSQTTQDTTMTTALGSADGIVPEFRNVAYIVFNSLALEYYGHRVPNWEFIVKPHDDRHYTRDIVQEMLEDLGLTAGSGFDVSGITRSAFHPGYVVYGATEPVKALQPIMIAENLIAQERNGVLYFMDREATPTLALEEEFVGASDNDRPSGRAEIQESPINARLGEVTIQYVDSDNDHTAGTEKAFAWTDSPVTDPRMASGRWTKQTLNFNRYTMDGNKAKALAHRILWGSWADSMAFKFTLPTRYFGIQENDRLTVPVDGVDYTVIVRKVDTGQHGMMKIEASLDVNYAQDYSDWVTTD